MDRLARRPLSSAAEQRVPLSARLFRRSRGRFGGAGSVDGGSFAVVGAVAGAATDGSVIGAFAGAAGAGTGVVGEMIGFSKTDCGTLFGEDGVTEVVDGGAASASDWSASTAWPAPWAGQAARAAQAPCTTARNTSNKPSGSNNCSATSSRPRRCRTSWRRSQSKPARFVAGVAWRCSSKWDRRGPRRIRRRLGLRQRRVLEVVESHANVRKSGLQLKLAVARHATRHLAGRENRHIPPKVNGAR